MFNKLKNNRGIFGFVSDLFGGDDDSNLAGFELPEFEPDELFGQSQEQLFGVGGGILEGDIPDFLAPLAEAGGPEFQEMVNRITSDITTRVKESAASQGRGRGGGVSGRVAGTIADTVAGLSFADFERSLQGRRDIFNTGVGITEGVRGAGLQNQSQKNQFALNRSELDLSHRTALDELDFKEGELLGQGLGNLAGIFTQSGDLFGGGEGGGETSGIGAAAGGALAAAFGLPPQIGAAGGNFLEGQFFSEGGKVKKRGSAEIDDFGEFEDFQLSGAVA